MALLIIEAPRKNQEAKVALPERREVPIGNSDIQDAAPGGSGGSGHSAPILVGEESVLPNGKEPAPATAASPSVIAGQANSKNDSWMGWAIATLVVAALGVVGGTLLPHATFTPAAGIGLFAVYYILAQTLERITEVFTYLIPFIGKTNQKTKEQAINARDTAIKNVVSNLAQENGQAPAEQVTKAAEDQATVSAIRDNRTLFLWGVNVALASASCGLLGLFLLKTIGVSGVPLFVDVIVTGLAVGSGTKPLHDLISNVQKAKEAKEDATQKV